MDNMNIKVASNVGFTSLTQGNGNVGEFFNCHQIGFTGLTQRNSNVGE